MPEATESLGNELFLEIKADLSLAVFQYRGGAFPKDLRYLKGTLVRDPSGGKESNVEGKALQGLGGKRAAKHCGVAKTAAGQKAGHVVLSEVKGKLEIGGHDLQIFLFQQDIAQKIGGAGAVHEHGIPTFTATRAVKPK